YSLPLHSFPTRRSSDLNFAVIFCWLLSSAVVWIGTFAGWQFSNAAPNQDDLARKRYLSTFLQHDGGHYSTIASDGYADAPGKRRSEEHTSELQSRFDLV